MTEARHVESVATTIAELRAEHPANAGGLGWDFDGFRVWVESNEASLLAELDQYFADFRRIDASSLEAARAQAPVTRITAIQLDPPPDFGAGRELSVGEYKPSVKGAKEAYFEIADGRVVHKVRTGMWFLFGDESHLAIGPATANPNQVVNFVNNRMIQAALDKGALLGHAAAVCTRSEGGGLAKTLAIAGFSGMGKSTLSLHLMNDRRLDFLSNDRAMIHAGHVDGAGATHPAVIQGVPKHPRINPGTILNNPDLGGIIPPAQRAQFESLPTPELWALEHKFDGLIRECFPAQSFVLRGEFVALILLNWTLDGGAFVAKRIDVDSRRDLLPALMKAPGLFYRTPSSAASGASAGRSPDEYVACLEGVAVMEFSGGVDFDGARVAALELLGL